MKNLKRWFTLVELIVVITILAILWSIAFISLQGYSADARNSKRTSDLGSLESAMSTQLAEGQNIMSFASGVFDNQIITNLSIGGLTIAAPNTTTYNAGAINYTALPVKSTDFQDPSGGSYVVGVTTRNNGKHELAATMEQGAGSKVAKVIGDFNPRTNATVAGTAGTVTNTFIITNSTDINKFFPDDRVTHSVSWGRTIIKISPDGKTLTLNGTAANGTIALTANETAGLIDRKDTTPTQGTGTTNVSEWSANVPY